MTELRFGLVGAGGIAQAYVQRVRRPARRARSSAVADVRARGRRGRGRARRCAAPPTRRIDALLDDADARRGLVCTPPVTHPTIALAGDRARRVTCCARSRSRSTHRGRPDDDRRRRGGRRRRSRWPRSSASSTTSIRARQIVGVRDRSASSSLLENAFASRVDMAPAVERRPGDRRRRRAHRQRHPLGRHRPLLPRSDRRGAGGRGPSGCRTSGSRTRAQRAPAHRRRRARARSTSRGASTSRPTRTSTLYGSRRARSASAGTASRCRQASTPPSGREFGERLRQGRVHAARRSRTSARRSAARSRCAITDDDAIASVAGDRRGVRVAGARRLGRRSRARCRRSRPPASRWHDAIRTPERGSTRPRRSRTASRSATAPRSGPACTSVVPGTRIGDDCIVGEKTYVAYGVPIGDRVKLNAFVYVCTGVTIETGVMVGAGTIFTNDRYPRATTPDLATLRPSEPDEHTLPTHGGGGRDHRRGQRDRLRPHDRSLRDGRHGRGRHPVGAAVPPRRRPAGALGRGRVARRGAARAVLRRPPARPRRSSSCPVSGLRYAIRGRRGRSSSTRPRDAGAATSDGRRDA